VQLLVEYQLPGTADMYKQEQYIAEGSQYYYWVAYTAPKALFDKYHAYIDQAVGTFRFLQ
jgi:hypothetical protein